MIVSDEKQPVVFLPAEVFEEMKGMNPQKVTNILLGTRA